MKPKLKSTLNTLPQSCAKKSFGNLDKASPLSGFAVSFCAAHLHKTKSAWGKSLSSLLAPPLPAEPPVLLWARPYRELLFCSACLPGHRKLLVSSLCCSRVTAGCAILPPCIWAGLSPGTGSLPCTYRRVFTKCICTNKLLVPCPGYIEVYGAEKQSLLLCVTASHVHGFWLGRPEGKMESLRPGPPERREHQNSLVFYSHIKQQMACDRGAAQSSSPALHHGGGAWEQITTGSSHPRGQGLGITSSPPLSTPGTNNGFAHGTNAMFWKCMQETEQLSDWGRKWPIFNRMRKTMTNH